MSNKKSKTKGTNKYDTIIIGTGQAGKPLAIALAKEGWKVAIIEKRFVGGSCINYGCTPTKTLIASAKAAYLASRSKDFGIYTGKIKVNFAEVIKRKDKIVKIFRDSVIKSLEENKNIKLILGTASFLSANEVGVKLKNGRTQKLQSKNIFINTGTTPFIPQVDGLDETRYFTSESLMNIKKIPRHLIIIGGSYIAVEFGQMFRRFGSEVTLIEKNSKLLANEDEDVSGEITQILKDEGITIFTSASLNSVKKADSKNIRVTFNVNAKEKIISCTQIMIATGMKPNTEKLGLNKAGIQTDERGFIKVNEKLETNIKGIFALGDVKGGLAFTHVSYDDYRIIFANLIKKENNTTRNRLIPYTIFTDPQIGRIGLSEKEAVTKSIKFKTAKLPMKYSARAIETGETKGFIKALIDPETKKILGCAVIGTEGGEIMAMIQIAMMGGLEYTKLRDGIFSHPTLSETLNNLFLKFEL
ncbi:MAG: mercuric reductase [Bacteroidota bacterium]|nr:mercuric reductase [Bacteroidota bacterium]